jgi:hypothetical protein
MGNRFTSFAAVLKYSCWLAEGNVKALENG